MKKKLLVFSLVSLLVIGLAMSASGFWIFSDDEAEDEEIEITVATGAVGVEFEKAQEHARRYEEQNPDVSVEILDTPDGADDRLGLYMQFLEAESSEVDIYQIDVIWPGTLNDHFIDLHDYVEQDVIDQHFDSIVENNTVDGELIGLPWFTDAGMLYYRTDLLEEYGYDSPPETWDELEEIARTVQEGEREAGNQDFHGFVFQGDSYEGLTCNGLEWIKSHNGGNIVSPQGEVTINNEGAIEAIERAGDWIGDISPSGVAGMREEDTRPVFQSGNAMFLRNWPYVYDLAQGEDSAIAGDFGVAPLPSVEGADPAHTLGGWQLAVSEYSEHKEVAADVAQFFTSKEEQKDRAIDITQAPTIPELYDDEEVREAAPFFDELYDVLVNAAPRPSAATGPAYSDVSRAFYEELNSVLRGDQSAEDAVEYMELEIQNATGFDVGEPQN